MSFIASNTEMFRPSKQPHKYNLIESNHRFAVVQPSASGQHSGSRWIIWRTCNAVMVAFFTLSAVVQVICCCVAYAYHINVCITCVCSIMLDEIGVIDGEIRSLHRLSLHRLSDFRAFT